MLKWVGASLVLTSCGSAGFLMAARYRKEEASVRQLIRALDYMQCELQFRQTPLPQLCRQAAREVRGEVQAMLDTLAEELERQVAPDAVSCMGAALQRLDLSARLKTGFGMLGSTLGRFDLEGQLRGLEGVREYCRRELEELSGNRETRIRSYETLGLCAGAALAILLV